MADQGKNEAAKSLLDLQPTTVLELYKLHADFQNRPEIFFTFHGGTNFSNNITWQGIQYIPLPVETEGFGVFADGTLPRPKIRVGNHNKIVTVFLEKFSDFKNAAVFRKKVFLKHLDDVNFDGGNPFGVANPSAEISEEKYFIGIYQGFFSSAEGYPYKTQGLLTGTLFIKPSVMVSRSLNG